MDFYVDILEENKENAESTLLLSTQSLSVSKNLNTQWSIDDLFNGDGELSDVAENVPSSPLTSLSSFSDSDVSIYERPKKRKKRQKVKQEEVIFGPYVEPSLVSLVPGYPLKQFHQNGLYAPPLSHSLSPPQSMVSYQTETENRETRRKIKLGLSGGCKVGRLLPLPIDYGEWYLNTTRNFSLPFNILFEHDNNLIIHNRQPYPYHKIKSNIFVERKKRVGTHAAVCACTRPVDDGIGCLEDCINRCMFYECNVKACPAGTQCSNRRFQMKQRVNELEVYYTGIARGFGLKTLVPIKKGQFVLEYCGEVISKETASYRMENDYKTAKCYYFLDYGNGEVLDGTMKGNEARFANHSCDPNCHIEKWHVDGEFAIGIFASRNIAAGTELAYDYNFHNFSDKKQGCMCGAANCRGILSKSTEFQKIHENIPEDVIPTMAKQIKKMKTVGELRSGASVTSIAELRREHCGQSAILPRNIKCIFPNVKKVEYARRTFEQIFKF